MWRQRPQQQPWQQQWSQQQQWQQHRWPQQQQWPWHSSAYGNLHHGALSDPASTHTGALEVLSVGAVATTSLVTAYIAGSGAASPTAQLSFTLDSGASSCFFRDCTDLTPLHTPVTVALADPSVGSVVAYNTTTLLCPTAPSGFLTGNYTPSFSRNLVDVNHLHDLGDVTTFPLDEPIAPCTVGATGVPLATFHREPGSGLYSLHTRSHHTGSGLPESLALLPRSPTPPCTPCVEGRQRAAPHSSSSPPTTTPLQTLHLDADVPNVLEPWLLARGGAQGLCGLRLHSDRGAERRIGLFMEVARTSMCHAGAPQFLWPQAVRYAAHQLNLWPSDARPRVTPVSLWTGSPGVAADYRVWGCPAHVRAPDANNLSARTSACVFLGFPLDVSGWVFYDPLTHQFFASQDITFDESVNYYRSRPHRGSEAFPAPFFLTQAVQAAAGATGGSLSCCWVGRGAGGSGEAQAQGQPRDPTMSPMQPSLGPPRDEPRVFGLGKFNGDNFAEWSFKMENIFDHYGLLEVMEGTEKRPENDPEKSPWVRKSAQGYLLFGQALGSSQIRHIKPFQREPEKGPKAWAALKGVHAPATAAVAVVLERQMAALRIEEDETVEEGVQKFFDLLRRLEGADLNYSELQKKTKLLALIPESWSSLIINLNRDLPRLSLEDVKRAILQEDFRRQGRGAGGGRGRGRGGHGGRGGGAANMKNGDNESESRDDRLPGQFFFVSTQALAAPEKDESFEEPAVVGKVTIQSLDYWVIDCGATYSMTPRADLLTELEPSPVKHVTSALGQRAEVKGMGKAMFKGVDGKMVGLKNVLWVPKIVANLIFVQRLQKAGMDTSSKEAKTYTARIGERVLWDLHEDRDVYNEMWQIFVVPMPKKRQVATSVSTKGEAVGSGYGANDGTKAKESNKCKQGGTSKQCELEESGAAAKEQHKGEDNPKAAAEEEYGESISEATAKAPLDDVVMDVVGPLKLGAAGAEYFLTIVDVYTRMTWVYVLSKKSDVAETVKTDWLPMVERQQDRLVKAIRTNQGGQFMSKEFSLWLKKNDIRHSLTMPYSPAMNGIAKRVNRTITETARGLLIEAGLPNYLWPDAVRSACVAKNRALTHVGAEKWVPYVEWIRRKPKVDMLRVFECMCMALVPKHLRHNKLGAEAIWAVHLGMAQNSKGWLLWDPFTKKFFVSRDCKFMENLMYKDWKAENETKIGMRFGEVKSSSLEHVELAAFGAEEEGRGKRRIQALNRQTYDALGKPARSALAGATLIVGDDEESDYEECAFAFLFFGGDAGGTSNSQGGIGQ
ncbi:unnamed protein product [Closterium sp. NIES-53]